jgi:nucleolar MIF4G domain-containing protein 1
LENINSVFIYDLIRFLIDNFNENNSEYLLLLLSYTGISIRKENPTNLKEIISLINIKYNNLKITNDENATDKLKYIIDMINDIKQNKYLKFNLQEKFNFFKEIINKRKSDAVLMGEKIEIELDKIIKLSYDKILSNNIITNKEKIEEIVDLDADNLIIKETQEDTKLTKQLNDTMKKLGISTGLKKMIFTNIATSNNVNDAFERLCRLNLNKEQKREIIKMIVKLCIEEPSYNPFYQMLLVKLLTLDKDNKYTYHYCVWDYMKIFENFKNIKKIHNLSKLTCNLLLGEKISLPVLLHFKFEEDNEENKMFVNMTLNKYFTDSNEDRVKLLFAKLVKNDEHVEFAQKLFNYLVKDFSVETDIEKKDSKYQDNYGAALKVLKKVL